MKTTSLVHCIILTVAILLPTGIEAGFLSKSFMKSYSARMHLQSQRKVMSVSLSQKRLEKEYAVLLAQQKDGGKVDIAQLNNISYRLYNINNELSEAENEAKFWKEISDSYKNAESSSPATSQTKTGKNSDDNMVITTQHMKCSCVTGKCFMCHGTGFLPYTRGRELCYCGGTGLCNKCYGKGEIEVTSTFYKDTGYYCTTSSSGIAVNGCIGPSSYGNGASSGSSGSGSVINSKATYEENYRSLERHAESIYKSITYEIESSKERKSDIAGWRYSSSYSGMAREFIRAQSDMKRLRADAQREKVFISPSPWETKVIRY